jgi:uncharacterized RDD family membrane protein YckC
MIENLRIVERNKASKGARFLNFLIDRTVIILFFVGLGFLAATLYQFFEIEFLIKFVYKLEGLTRFEDILLGWITYFLYVFLTEYFCNGKTLGKLLTGTRVVSMDGSKPSGKEFFIRNISRLVPFDAFSFLGDIGWHDSWSNTRVVHDKKFLNEINKNTEIDEIGNKGLL